MSKLPIFEHFLIVGNLKPKREVVFSSQNSSRTLCLLNLVPQMRPLLRARLHREVAERGRQQRELPHVQREGQQERREGALRRQVEGHRHLRKGQGRLGPGEGQEGLQVGRVERDLATLT